MTKAKIKETLKFSYDMIGASLESKEQASTAIKTEADKLGYEVSSFDVEETLDAKIGLSTYRLSAIGTK